MIFVKKASLISHFLLPEKTAFCQKATRFAGNRLQFDRNCAHFARIMFLLLFIAKYVRL
jgi:hypothetical protein